jgi:hypothetical protein
MSRFSLPYARLRLEVQVTSPLRLPEYAGSMLRGAFGGALRRLACMTRQPECTGCGLLRTCPYAVLFETAPPPEGHVLQRFSEVPKPYVIEPPAWGARLMSPGQTFSFGLVLFGRALAQTPLAFLAWQRALARGIGPGDGRGRLLRVVHEAQDGERLVLDVGQGIAEEVRADEPPEAGPLPESVSLRFDTPLRLQENGHALGAERVDARRLLMALARRASLLAEFHGGGAPGLDFTALAAHAATLAESRQLTWQDWTRYSSRQQQKMQLGGLVGSWTLSGDLAPFWPLLQLGEFLHVGKEAAFGLGRYQLQPPIRQTSPAPAEKPANPSCKPLMMKGETEPAIQTKP